MKNPNVSEEIKRLLTHKGGLCASLIIPVHSIPSEKPTDRIEIEHSIEKLKSKFAQMNKQESILLKKVNEIKNQVIDIKGEYGVGIFVSGEISMITTFPFEVKEKIVVADSFEIRDLVQKERYTKEYFVLSLNGYGARLFRGKEKNFKEISDKNFPVSYDGVEYEAPVIENQGNNATQTMKREKATTVRSVDAYYKLLDEKLKTYLNDSTPLIIGGVEKELAHFQNSSCHQSKIKGKVFGSFDDHNLGELYIQAWDDMKLYLRLEERELLHRLKEMGREFVSVGLSDVWFDVKQGKSNILFVEKDLEQKGYLSEDGFNLRKEPSGNNLKPVPDAVDDIVEMMLETNGKVVFVENGLLRDYSGIAVINRY
jgi:hypothetical protein